MTARRTRRPSGRFLLRMPPGLHAALRRAAEQAGISLNDYCVRRLSAPAGEVDGAPEAVLRAATRFGDALLGVVVFGSLPRGELREGSDVDLLIVLEDSVALTRELYRSWDVSPLLWDGRAVEPHFVHLPPPDRTVAGLWAEVALDGLVLFARGPELARRLVRVRRDIASGRLLRRRVHGQPYWVEAACDAEPGPRR